MLERLKYKGCLIETTSLAGERKCDGVVPGHPGGGALRVSCDRWLIFFATIDTRGWDSNRSIIYHLRSGSPDGELIKEGMLAGCDEEWELLDGGGERYFKSLGMPIAFGVPKGATRSGGVIANSNVFVVKWYRWAHLARGERLLNADLHGDEWLEGAAVRNKTLRIEWLQFRLNEQEDDIELLTSPAVLRQKGYEQGAEFCSLGPNVFSNHAMKAPEVYSSDFREWLSFDTFVPFGVSGGPGVGHGAIAPVRFCYNDRLGLYEWVETGSLFSLPGRRIGETSLNRIGDDWILCARSFSKDWETCWWRIEDPLAGLPEPVLRPNAQGPRIAFGCGDGRLRLFSNLSQANNGPYDRNPLCCWEVDIDDFSYGDADVIAEAKSLGLRFSRPMLDMAKLCPAQGRRQLLLFRAITQQHTASMPDAPAICAEEDADAGIHFAELEYDIAVAEEWQFDSLAAARPALVNKARQGDGVLPG